MDVVYNHTAAAGQDPNSVLDQVVPGYYQRLSATGAQETSTCCANTASEHAMMEKLMIESIVTWARQYKVDGFRFDLMGHHSKANMEHIRAALDQLTPRRDGVDGRKIFLYGEGWNFGEVADNARFVQATQANMAGTGSPPSPTGSGTACVAVRRSKTIPACRDSARACTPTRMAHRPTGRRTNSENGCCTTRT